MSIILDAEVVREEVHDRYHYDFAGGLTAEEHRYITSLTDEQINDAIELATDDHFMAAFDSLRSDVISALLADRNDGETTTTTPMKESA